MSDALPENFDNNACDDRLYAVYDLCLSQVPVNAFVPYRLTVHFFDPTFFTSNDIYHTNSYL